MPELQSRVALITGAAGGIGQATAQRFLQEGAVVVLADLDPARIGVPEEAAASRHRLDVTAEGDWAEVIAAIGEQHGRLDVLVNAAGIFEVATIAGTSLEMFERTIRINQTGTFLGIRHAAPLMAQAGKGAIVNLSSAAGLVGTPGTIAYSASKWAVRGMTKVAACELGSLGIRVNSVHPGAVDTDMTRFIKGDASALGSKRVNRLGRVAEPQEVAEMILFLASDRSSYSTGSEFVMDAGLTAG